MIPQRHAALSTSLVVHQAEAIEPAVVHSAEAIEPAVVNSAEAIEPAVARGSICKSYMLLRTTGGQIDRFFWWGNRAAPQIESTRNQSNRCSLHLSLGFEWRCVLDNLFTTEECHQAVVYWMILLTSSCQLPSSQPTSCKCLHCFGPCERTK